MKLCKYRGPWGTRLFHRTFASFRTNKDWRGLPQKSSFSTERVNFSWQTTSSSVKKGSFSVENESSSVENECSSVENENRCARICTIQKKWRLDGLEIFHINALKRARNTKLRTHNKVCLGQHFFGYRIYSFKRRPRLSTAYESKNIKERCPRIIAAPIHNNAGA